MGTDPVAASPRAAPPSEWLRAYAALAVGILAISLAAFFVRWAQAPGPVTSAYRMGMAMVIQVPWLLVILRKSRQHGAAPHRNQPLWAILAGLAMGFCLILWSIAVQTTRVANASLLGNTAPFFVALYVWLVVRVPLGRNFWVGLLLALAGLTVFVGWDFLLHPALARGDLLAVVSALFYGAYYLLVEQSRRSMDTIRTIWLINLVSALVLLAYCALAGLNLFAYPPSTWLLFLLNALIPQTIGYIAMTYAQGRIPAWIISPTMILQPVLTALLAIPILGERPGLPQILGGLAVLAGIWLVNRARSAA